MFSIDRATPTTLSRQIEEKLRQLVDNRVLAGGAKPVLAIPRKWDEVGMFDKKRKRLVELAKASERAHDPAKDQATDRYVPSSARRS